MQEEEKGENILDIDCSFEGVDKSSAKLVGMDFYKSDFMTLAGRGSALYQYQCLSETEKQVYIPPQRLNILTDSRIVELVHIRPIDYLSIIVSNITSNLSHSKLIDVSNPNTLQVIYSDLDDFIEQFTIKEVCAMCIQILSDPNSMYMLSFKINQMIN